MKRAILTGFEPFGPYKYNPVQDTAREFDRRIIGGVEIVGLVLPGSYYAAFDILYEKMHSLSPDIILSSGLASRVQCIQLEQVGRNIMNGKYEDCDGRKPHNEPIIPGALACYAANTNSAQLVHALRRESIPAELSFDAEGFFCNSLIYLTSRKIAEEDLPIKFAFFHTPWTSDYLDRIVLEPGKVTITKDDLRRTISTLISELAP